jgi:hypothetical protein
MYRLNGDPVLIRDAVHTWREKMNADVEGKVMLPEFGIWGQIDDRPRIAAPRTNRYLSHFRVQTALQPHAVEIHIPEERISYWRRETGARQIHNRQARVWRALRALFGIRMHKPVIGPLETDAMIERPGELPLLVEIKSDSGAAAIEQGLGQLLLYGGLYRRHPEGSDVELVMLLPSVPRSALTEVLADYSIIVTTYDESTDPPTISSDFLALCRYQAEEEPSDAP